MLCGEINYPDSQKALFFCFKTFLMYLRISMRYRWTELPSTGALPRYLQQLESGQAWARSGELQLSHRAAAASRSVVCVSGDLVRSRGGPDPGHSNTGFTCSTAALPLHPRGGLTGVSGSWCWLSPALAI